MGTRPHAYGRNSYGKILFKLKHIKLTGKFCNIFISNLCKWIPNLSLIWEGKEQDGEQAVQLISSNYQLAALDYPLGRPSML